MPAKQAMKNATRKLVNVRLRMMFRPELIYIFDLIVNQMKRIKNICLS